MKLIRMNHDATHCSDFCADCPMNCYRASLEVDLRGRWAEFIGVPLSYAHLYGTEECKRDAHHKERKENVQAGEQLYTHEEVWGTGTERIKRIKGGDE